MYKEFSAAVLEINRFSVGDGAKHHNLAQRVIQVKDIKAEFLSPSDHPR